MAVLMGVGFITTLLIAEPNVEITMPLNVLARVSGLSGQDEACGGGAT